MIPVGDDNVTRHAPVASRTILGACCVAFAWQVFSGPWGELAPRALGFTPAHFFSGGTDDPLLAWTPFAVPLVSYMFLHGGWLHLLGNMLFLWVFGDDVEDALGQPGFIVFYLACGIAAALAQGLPEPESTTSVIGASGAISGLLGAYLVLYPRSEVSVLVPVFIVVELVRLPAWVVLLFWFAVQVAFEFAPAGVDGGIAFRAHIGGFIAGMLLVPLFRAASGRRRARLSTGAGGLVR